MYAVPIMSGGVPFLTPDIFEEIISTTTPVPNAFVLWSAFDPNPEYAEVGNAIQTTTFPSRFGLSTVQSIFAPRNPFLTSSEQTLVPASSKRLVEVTPQGRKALQLPAEYEAVNIRWNAGGWSCVLPAVAVSDDGRSSTYRLTNPSSPTNYYFLRTFCSSPLDVFRFLDQEARTPTLTNEFRNIGEKLCFGGDYPFMLARDGLALVLRTDEVTDAAWVGLDAHPIVHLRDPQYYRNVSPLNYHCPCLTCKQHTRAYLHHLLRTHEMNATILLVVHNLTTMLRFFAKLRLAIQQGYYERYREFIL
eukprot:PhF_6_TR15667/c0_g1_i5/m.24355/K15407/QTRTD1; queuine tRNA-ribosyltransferase subunit QTRTD1